MNLLINSILKNYGACCILKNYGTANVAAIERYFQCPETNLPFKQMLKLIPDEGQKLMLIERNHQQDREISNKQI